jgi:soluble lytic murein transglycosylase-like protein
VLAALAPLSTLAADPAGLPALSLEALPRPSAPAPEPGPVVPSQVQRWRQEAKAHEFGEDGMPKDPKRAAELYCRAARYGDAESQFSLAWMLTNSRGIERDDAQAAHLFAAAAEQGMVQAKNMAAALGTPRGQPPACLRPPEADPPPTAAIARPAETGPGTTRPGGLSPVGGDPWAHLDAPPNAPEVIVRFVKLVAPEYKLSPALVLAVMATESNFDPLATSPRNAQGLMQLMPETAARFKVRKPSDPAQNIRGGMAYLQWLLAYFQGDLSLALAGYNAGEGAVDRYRGVPPYAETRRYVQRIRLALAGASRHDYDPRVSRPTTALPLAR